MGKSELIEKQHCYLKDALRAAAKMVRFNSGTLYRVHAPSHRPPAKPSVPALGCRSAAERALQRSAC